MTSPKRKQGQSAPSEPLPEELLVMLADHTALGGFTLRICTDARGQNRGAGLGAPDALVSAIPQDRRRRKEFNTCWIWHLHPDGTNAEHVLSDEYRWAVPVEFLGDYGHPKDDQGMLIQSAWDEAVRWAFQDIEDGDMLGADYALSACDIYGKEFFAVSRLVHTEGGVELALGERAAEPEAYVFDFKHGQWDDWSGHAWMCAGCEETFPVDASYSEDGNGDRLCEECA